MKIGVLSDTHGNLDITKRVVAQLLDKYEVDTIIHLGDDSTDLDIIGNVPVDIVWVPGLYESRYQDPTIPNRIIRDFSEVPFLLTHTPTRDSHDLEDDIDPTEVINDGDVKVVLHGHSHKWRIDEDRGVIFINPGHLNPKDARGNGLSFGLIDLTEKKMNVRIIDTNGDLLGEKTFFFDVI